MKANARTVFIGGERRRFGRIGLASEELRRVIRFGGPHSRGYGRDCGVRRGRCRG